MSNKTWIKKNGSLILWFAVGPRLCSASAKPEGIFRLVGDAVTLFLLSIPTSLGGHPLVRDSRFFSVNAFTPVVQQAFMELELVISNEPRVLPGVQGFISQTLGLVRLTEQDVLELEQFVLEVVDDAIEHAYPTGETGSIKISLTEKQDRLELSVRDFGLPQDVELLERRLQESGGRHVALQGSHQVDIADEVHWEAFGREGKAIKLVKQLHRQHVGQGQQLPDLSVEVQPPLAPEQEYEIRRMLPEEAVQVSQLMYRTYGDTYFNEDVYFPQRIAAQNANGTLISVVAIDQDGKVIGHEAVECVSSGPVVELGQAAIDSRHRGRGLMSRMKTLLVQEVDRMKLTGWFADAVAVHTLTQKSNAHHEGHVCGVELGISPKTESFHSLADELSQRLSCLIYFHWVDEPKKRRVSVPARHQAIVAEIYDNLKCPVEFAEGVSVEQDPGALKIRCVPGSASAFISVDRPGADLVPAIRHAVREVIEVSRMEAVFVDLPLADPATAGVWDSLASCGLGFVGIGPHFSPLGDVVRLVYLVEPMAREPIKTFEPFAGKLVDYALAEQQRVRQGL